MKVRQMSQSNFKINLKITIAMIIILAIGLPLIGAGSGKWEAVVVGLWGALAVVVVGTIALTIATIYHQTKKPQA